MPSTKHLLLDFLHVGGLTTHAGLLPHTHARALSHTITHHGTPSHRCHVQAISTARRRLTFASGRFSSRAVRLSRWPHSPSDTRDALLLHAALATDRDALSCALDSTLVFFCTCFVNCVINTASEETFPGGKAPAIAHNKLCDFMTLVWTLVYMNRKESQGLGAFTKKNNNMRVK